MGLGGLALSTACPAAAPIVATFCFTGAGGLTLGSAGAGAVALGAKLKKDSQNPWNEKNKLNEDLINN